MMKEDLGAHIFIFHYDRKRSDKKTCNRPELLGSPMMRIKVKNHSIELDCIELQITFIILLRRCVNSFTQSLPSATYPPIHPFPYLLQVQHLAPPLRLSLYSKYP